MAVDNHKMSIGLKRATSYGVGDLGFNLFYTGLNLYLLFYYTDVIGISPEIAGLIFMAPVLWDALTDPIMGVIAPRTRTRFGSYRPYILFGGPFLGVSFVMIFAAPVLWPEAIIAVCFLSHIIFRTAYTAVNIPYSCLSAAMTHDGGERALLAGARMQFSTLGGVATAFITPWFADLLGNDNLKQGYLLTAVLYAVVAFIAFSFTFASSTENSACDMSPKRLPLNQTMKFLTHNKAFWVLLLAVVVAIFGVSVANKALIYYVSYFANKPEAVRLVLTLSAVMISVSVVFWTILGQRYSKRLAWMVGAAGSVAAQFLLFSLAPDDLAIIYLLIGINGFFTGAIVVMLWAMLPDTVEYGEWKSGIRDEGILFGLNHLSQKIASGLGIGLVGFVLEAIGYIPNQPQTPETLESLKFLCFFVPAVTAGIALMIISRYPLNNQLHKEIVAKLDKTANLHSKPE